MRRVDLARDAVRRPGAVVPAGDQHVSIYQPARATAVSEPIAEYRQVLRLSPAQRVEYAVECRFRLVLPVE